MNLSGPDIHSTQCRPPDGCCGPLPCVISEDDFICQIRQLLPEGDLWNTTLPSKPPESELAAIAAAAVGCMLVGCQQLVLGSCCDEGAIPCDDKVTAPQLAVVDAFSAVAYKAIQALCDMLKELDPCTADVTLPRWGKRFGLVSDDRCAPQWSDHTISLLICTMLQVKWHVMNWAYLEEIAARFGAHLELREAGDMNCGPLGWWTMARDRNDCPPPDACPPEARPKYWPPVMRAGAPCASTPPSLNIVTSPDDIRIPANCNLGPAQTLPHDPELYDAFKWLMPKILPQPVFYCVYEKDLPNCIQ